MSVKPELSRKIKEKAAGLGFDLCGIARLRPLDEHSENIRNWLEKGYHAGMNYMSNNFEKRIDPSLLVADARSLIVVAMNHYRHYNPGEDKPVFSRYALGKDYHKVLKDRLYLLLDFIKHESAGVKGRVFVDTAPVLERAWAVEAGLGWTGRNSMLINRDKGSYIFLGLLIVNARLEYDSPAPKDYCGSCRKCIDACPTEAIMESRMIDSNKCLSYLTIENKGEFPREYAEKKGKIIFGCDICQEVCPWNNKVKETMLEEFKPMPEILDYNAQQWRKITEEEFYSIFKDSAVLRAGYKGFIRNI
ncbi:MAG: tRNA epoxyqueuosine(34) reductase QueG [Bacteroidales bacterium]|nr:tRNA epoxyqueuosine(34) reductase QueG [Bacteroidales bacterium]